MGAIMYQGIRRVYTANWAPAKRSGGHISIIRGNYSERGARPSSSILIFSARKPPPPLPARARTHSRTHTSIPVADAKLVPSNVPPPSLFHGDDPMRLYAREVGIIRVHHQSGEKIAFNCDYRGGSGSPRHGIARSLTESVYLYVSSCSFLRPCRRSLRVRVSLRTCVEVS